MTEQRSSLRRLLSRALPLLAADDRDPQDAETRVRPRSGPPSPRLPSKQAAALPPLPDLTAALSPTAPSR